MATYPRYLKLHCGRAYTTRSCRRKVKKGGERQVERPRLPRVSQQEGGSTEFLTAETVLENRTPHVHSKRSRRGTCQCCTVPSQDFRIAKSLSQRNWVTTSFGMNAMVIGSIFWHVIFTPIFLPRCRMCP